MQQLLVAHFHSVLAKTDVRMELNLGSDPKKTTKYRDKNKMMIHPRRNDPVLQAYLQQLSVAHFHSVLAETDVRMELVLVTDAPLGIHLGVARRTGSSVAMLQRDDN